MPVTTPPTITALPTPPDPNDRATFNTRAYPWSVAQQTLATEVGAVADNVFDNATDAAASAVAADASAVAADASQLAAADSQTAAALSAVAASDSHAAAAASAVAADASADAAAASYDSFDDRYLGAKTSSPTLDNDGNTLIVGAKYFNSTESKMYVRNSSSAWQLDTADSALVNYLPDGTGAVATNVQIKLREFCSVKDFGAIGDGIADDTNAFSAAAKGVLAVVNIVTGAALPKAPMCKIFVPAGNYILTSEVDTENREVLWELDQAAIITGYEFINGEVIRIGQRQADYHHGSTDYACTYSIRANVDLEDDAEVLGITSASDLAIYRDRDSVTLYVDNRGPAATVDVGAATYTSATVTIAAPSAAQLRQYRRGMIIDTKHTPKWSGVIDSWSLDGSVLTVTGWYEFGGGGSPGTPANGTGCVINGFTKVWSHNANVFLSGSSHATKATGFELGVLNNKGALDFTNQINYMWGFDAVNLGTYEGAVGFIARPGSAKFYRGFQCSDATQAGFVVGGSPVNGFWSEQSSGSPFRHTVSGVDRFSVDINGMVTAKGGFVSSSTSAFMSLGTTSASSSPVIDFNSSGNLVDYDARLSAEGGTGVTGNGTLSITAAVTRASAAFLAGGISRTATSAGFAIVEGQSTAQPSIFTARCGTNDATQPIFHFIKDRAATDVQDGDGLGEIRFEGNHTGYKRGGSIFVGVSGTPSSTSMPGMMNFRVSKAGSTVPTTAFTIQSDHHIAAGADNVQTLGTAALRWSVVYAGTGTINTSDGREKQDIEVLTAAELRVAMALKGLIKKFRFRDAVQAKGDAARTHVGVIAQEVIEAFQAEGLDATRYGIICYDEWDESPAQFDEDGNVSQEARPAGNRFGVRYEELMAFIISAL